MMQEQIAQRHSDNQDDDNHGAVDWGLIILTLIFNLPC